MSSYRYLCGTITSCRNGPMAKFVRSRQYNHGRPYSHTVIKVCDIVVGETNASRGHEAANRRWLIGAMDPKLRVAEIHRACTERIGFTTGHEARQVRLALNHLLRRKPIRPFFHPANVLGARPGEALTPDTNPVAKRLAVPHRQVKVGVRRIDYDGARRLDCGVIHHRALKSRR